MTEKENTENILLRAPNWIGDAVMTLPAISALKQLLPDAEITLLTKPWVSAVYLNNPHIKDIIEIQERHSGISGRIKLIKELKEKKFDACILFNNAFSAGLMSFLCKIPKRIGYARDLRGALLTDRVIFTEEIKKSHQIFYYLNIIKHLDGVIASEAWQSPVASDNISFENIPQPIIYLKKDELEQGEELLKSMGIPTDGFLFGISPGASFGPAKRWRIEGFKEVMEKLSVEFSAVPVICGGKADVAIGETLSKHLSIKHFNIAGRVSLREFISLMPHFKLFITNDSGPMHLAYGVGVPTVGIFGSTDPSLTGPVGKKIECSPCFKKECPYGHYRCMTDIKTEDVLTAARDVLTETGGI